LQVRELKLLRVTKTNSVFRHPSALTHAGVLRCEVSYTYTFVNNSKYNYNNYLGAAARVLAALPNWRWLPGQEHCLASAPELDFAT
jgi:hypothetical protein